MEQTHEGQLDAAGLRFAIVATRFHDEIVSRLVEAAVDCLERHGATRDMIALYRVPGAFELPVTVSHLAKDDLYDAVIALGAVIRGETPHFDFISSAVTAELARISVDTGIPVAFGVITSDTVEQAEARSRKGSSKGWEAALAAIQMADLLRVIR
jgi:6,7-dimethyl-8-ribityllumazine synthase